MDLFCGHEQGCRLGQGLLLTSELLLLLRRSLRLQGLDLPLVLGAELFKLFLLSRLGKLADCVDKVSTGLSLAFLDACRQRSSCSGNRPRSRQ
jgi:hypothetical protein